MPNNAPDGYIFPYRDRTYTNLYLNFTEGHPLYSYSSNNFTPNFGTSAPILSLMAYDTEITNTNATYAMSPNMSPHFIGNCGEDRNIDAHAATWKIYADDTELYTGPFSASLRTALTNHYKPSHTPHKLRIVVDNNNFKLDDIQGNHHVEMSFMENAADVVPPTLTGWRMKDSNGLITNRFPDGNATLTFSFADLVADSVTKVGLIRLHCDAKVECAPHGTSMFREIPTTEVNEMYSEFYGWFRQCELSPTTIDPLTNGWYDLRFTLTDAAGNTQTQTISPAFYAKWNTGGVNNTEGDDIRIISEGCRISVYGADSADLFAIDGRYVASASGNGSVSFLAPSAGIYVLRIGERTFKIFVR